MEKLEKLTQKLQDAKSLFEEIKELETSTKSDEVQLLEKIFKMLKPILPFIHSPIVVFNNESLSQNGWIGWKLYSKQKYLVLCKYEEKEQTSQFNWVSTTNLYVLTDDLEIRKYTYEASWSQYQYSGYYEATIAYEEYNSMMYTKNELHDICEKRYDVITIQQLLNEVNFDDVLDNIINTFNKAIESNKNKRIQLQSRLEKLNKIKELIGE